MEKEEIFDTKLWDDDLIIESYKISSKISKEKLARKIAGDTNKKQEKIEQSGSKCFDFSVGDYARATFSDGIDYEAKIISISGETCTIHYIGYNNEEQLYLSELLPSWGKKARRLQFENAKNFKKKSDCVKDIYSKKNVKNIRQDFFIPPPPPLPPLASVDLNQIEDSEQLFAMLMSWYMSGYYTGMYQGIQRAKKKSKK